MFRCPPFVSRFEKEAGTPNTSTMSLAEATNSLPLVDSWKGLPSCRLQSAFCLDATRRQRRSARRLPAGVSSPLLEQGESENKLGDCDWHIATEMLHRPVESANPFSGLTRGRLATVPRQRTLKASLDWSYELLQAFFQDSPPTHQRQDFCRPSLTLGP